MHIPDGMLEARTWIPAWLASAGLIAWALRRVRQTLAEGGIVLMAVMAALVFTLQMLNFPVAGGTSGHFSGGAAAAIVLGLWPAMAVMAAVVVVQAVFFADGGITALGANMLTLAVVGPAIGAAIYRAAVRVRPTRRMKLAASFASAWAATMCAALAAGVLLWLSGRVPLGPALVAMGGWHTLIGVGEGAITAGLIGYLLAVRPDLLAANERDPAAARTVAASFAVIALLGAVLSLFASAEPDGLEYVYQQLGSAFEPVSVIASPMPDYVLPGVSNTALAGVLAGIVGTIVAGALVSALLAALRGRATKDAE